MLQLRRSPCFPQELTDMIIDQLWDDKPSLSVCCQVARCWLPSSRYHLFHTTLVSISNSNPHTIPEFIHFLYSSTQICHHIRSLILRRPDDLIRVEHSSLDMRDVKAILSKLPNLLQFYLRGIDLTLLNSSGAEDIVHSPSLQFLSFWTMKMFGGLSSVLSYFPPVDSLDLLDVLVEQPHQTSSTESDSPDESIVSPNRPGIRYLSLWVNDGQVQNCPTHQGMQLESLSELCFSFSDPVQLQIIRPFIRRAPRLKELTLWLDQRHEPPNPEEWAELDLASATSLETLSVEFRLLDPLPTPHDDAIWFDLFSVFVDHGEKHLEGLDWKSLEQSLSRFSQLERVVFIISIDQKEEAEASGKYTELSKGFKEVLQRQLPDLHLKGKLEVEVVE
ncbi:hypothetical protein NLI96_g9060 [Meripilus lineatus]|uniref:F-box domain-containing protein n=1 Tax=Meripilus lineatus TaxID=2056292 RepID=A0AAD5UXW1_9APHY|nr:hypothetical protein NLI96_g9060 [Physisporinus lineatus]